MSNKYKKHATGAKFTEKNPDSLDWHIVHRAQEFSIKVYKEGVNLGSGAISLVLHDNKTVTGEGIIHDNNTDQDISVYVRGDVEYCADGIECKDARNDLIILNKDNDRLVSRLENDIWEALPFLIDANSSKYVCLFGVYEDPDGTSTVNVVAQFTGIFD